MKVLLTGATGYIGKAVAKELLESGHHVIGTARSQEQAAFLKSCGVEPLIADLSQSNLIAACATTCDGLIHTAASHSQNKAELDRGLTQHIINSFAGTGKPFIYTSGVWVMGDQGNKLCDETTPLNPAAISAWRVEVEQLVLDAKEKNIRTCVLRPSIVWGGPQGLSSGGLILEILNSGSDSLRYVGDGHNFWSFIEVADLAKLYVLALERAKPGSLYIATQDQALTLKQVVEMLAESKELQAFSWPLEDAREKLGTYADALAISLKVTGQKVHQELGFSPTKFFPASQKEVVNIL